MDYFEIFQRSFNWVPMADAAAKATVLLAAGGLIAALLRKGTAASRHLVWTCALLAALAVPLLSIALPRWEVPLLTLPAAPATTAVEPGAPRRTRRILVGTPRTPHIPGRTERA